ncbi:hypothetical protein GCM10027594_08760 [Hymenobacter agri]
MSEDEVILELNARWNCEIPFGWIPIYRASTDADVAEVYDEEYFHHFDDAVKKVLRETFHVSTLYEIEEGGTVRQLTLDECVFGYNGLEHMYSDLLFSFLIYFSHESSVTVGGRKLLDEIHRIWPESSMHLWPPPSWR